MHILLLQRVVEARARSALRYGNSVGCGIRVLCVGSSTLANSKLSSKDKREVTPLTRGQTVATKKRTKTIHYYSAVVLYAHIMFFVI